MTVVTCGNTPQQEKALQVKEKFAEELDALRVSPLFADLNKPAQARRIAALFVAAQDQLAVLRKDEGAAQSRRDREIEQALFGLPKGGDPASVISFRDANERCSRLASQGDAEELLQLARISRDDVLAKAILGKAMNAGWDAVINTYADQHPDAAALIQEKVDATAYTGSLTALAEGIGREAAFTMSPPVEIATWSSLAVESAAPDPEPTPLATLDDLVAPDGDPGIGNRGPNPSANFALGTSAAQL